MYNSELFNNYANMRMYTILEYCLMFIKLVQNYLFNKDYANKCQMYASVLSCKKLASISVIVIK